MGFFDRTKAILFNTKEEWTVIEAENKPDEKVFIRYLLILALIPAVTFLVSYLWSSSMFRIKLMESIFGSSDNENMSTFVGRIVYGDAGGEIGGIILALFQQFIVVVCGTYVTAAVINAFSSQFGSAKDFKRTYSLVAYSYTPLCVAGLLYFFSSLAWLIPYLGLYGLYLLYLGIEPQLKPAPEKKFTCFIFSLIAMIAVWAFFSKLLFQKLITEESSLFLLSVVFLVFFNGKIAKWKGYPFWVGAISAIVGSILGTILFLVIPFKQRK